MPDFPSEADLLAVIVTLVPLEMPEHPLPVWWGGASNKMLVNALATMDEKLSGSLKADNQSRPFTVSSLMGPMPSHHFVPGYAYRLRFTTLTNNLSMVLWQAVQSGGPLAAGASVELECIPFRVQSVFWEAGQHFLAGWDSYQSIQAKAALVPMPARYTGLEFHSPTYFSDISRSTHKDLPFPLPDLAFGSLLKRWNLFCSSLAFPEEVRRYANESMVLHSFEVRSRAALIKEAVLLGMVGKAEYKAVHYDRYWMGLIQALTDYAFFAGVGAKTAIGLGQTRRLLKKTPV